jgi:hypothetical protein
VEMPIMPSKFKSSFSAKYILNRLTSMAYVIVRFFQCGASVNILIISNFILGWMFWGNLFYLPLYMQVVRGWTPTLAGSYMLPMVTAHGVFSWLSGILVSSWGHYVPVISGGTAFWVVGLVWKTTFGVDTPVWMIWARGVFEGIGVGSTMQISMFYSQAVLGIAC